MWAKHKHPVDDCIEGVIYEIPVACGVPYVKRTARCLNERMMDHMRNVRIKALQSQLIGPVIDCINCYPRWNECAVPDVERDAYKSLVKEIMHILQSGSCVSHSSLSLDNITLSFWGVRV